MRARELLLGERMRRRLRAMAVQGCCGTPRCAARLCVDARWWRSLVLGPWTFMTGTILHTGGRWRAAAKARAGWLLMGTRAAVEGATRASYWARARRRAVAVWMSCWAREEVRGEQGAERGRSMAMGWFRRARAATGSGERGGMATGRLRCVGACAGFGERGSARTEVG